MPRTLSAALALLLLVTALPPAQALAADTYTIHMAGDSSSGTYSVTDSAGNDVTGAWGCAGVIPSPTGDGLEVRCSPGATSCSDPSVTGVADAVRVMGFAIVFPLFPPTLEVNGNCQNASGPSPAVGWCRASFGAPCSGSAAGTITGTVSLFCHAKPGGINVQWDATCTFELS